MILSLNNNFIKALYGFSWVNGNSVDATLAFLRSDTKAIFHKPNEISLKEMELISRELLKSSCEFFSLSNNCSFSDQHAQILAENIRKNTSLKVLILGKQNNLTFSGLDILADALSNNYTLEHLSFQLKNVRVERTAVTEKIVRYLIRNRTLKIYFRKTLLVKYLTFMKASPTKNLLSHLDRHYINVTSTDKVFKETIMNKLFFVLAAPHNFEPLKVVVNVNGGWKKGDDSDIWNIKDAIQELAIRYSANNSPKIQNMTLWRRPKQKLTTKQKIDMILQKKDSDNVTKTEDVLNLERYTRIVNKQSLAVKRRAIGKSKRSRKQTHLAYLDIQHSLYIYSVQQYSEILNNINMEIVFFNANKLMCKKEQLSELDKIRRLMRKVINLDNIVLVGQGIETRENVLQVLESLDISLVSKIRQLFVVDPSENVDTLKQSLLTCLEKSCVRVPLVWFRVLQSLKKKAGSNAVIPLTDFQKECFKFGIKSELHESILDYMHKQYFIFYTSSSQKIKKLVCIDPTGFRSAISSLLYPEHICTTTISKLFLTKELEIYKEQGILSLDLCEIIVPKNLMYYTLNWLTSKAFFIHLKGVRILGFDELADSYACSVVMPSIENIPSRQTANGFSIYKGCLKFNSNDSRLFLDTRLLLAFSITYFRYGNNDELLHMSHFYKNFIQIDCRNSQTISLTWNEKNTSIEFEINSSSWAFASKQIPKIMEILYQLNLHLFQGVLRYKTILEGIALENWENEQAEFVLKRKTEYTTSVIDIDQFVSEI